MKRTRALQLSCCTILTLMMMMIRAVHAWTLAHPSRHHRPSVASSFVLYVESLRTTTTSSSTTTTAQDCTILWDVELPVGARCVGLQRPGDTTSSDDDIKWVPSHTQLHPLEIEYGLQLPSTKTKQSFWLGRMALRQMIETSEPILKDSYGRPRLPTGYVASISHKADVGVALVQPPSRLVLTQHQQGSSLGVDLEWSQPQGNRNVARKVLTLQEQQTLGQIPVCNTHRQSFFALSLSLNHHHQSHSRLCLDSRDYERPSHRKKKYYYALV